MRKIFFVLFAAVLVLLILLVDWREKLSRVTESRPVKEIETMWPFQPPADTSNGLPQMDDLLFNELPTELVADKVVARPQPRADPPDVAQTKTLPPVPAPASRVFQDTPQQTYVDESRTLLRATMRNYGRIKDMSSTKTSNDQE